MSLKLNHPKILYNDKAQYSEHVQYSVINGAVNKVYSYVYLFLKLSL